MVWPAVASFLIGIAALLAYIRFPRRRKDPYADQPNTFKVWLVEPASEGAQGCFIILSLFLLAFGFQTQNHIIIWGAGAVTAYCLISIAVFLVIESKQAKVEANSQARIELTPDSILIFDQFGNLVNEAKFADIVDLPMYQGTLAKGRRYTDRILVMKPGEQILLPSYGIDGKQLKLRIQQATKLKFSYRNNSTRKLV